MTDAEQQFTDYLSRQPGHAFGDVLSASGKSMQPISRAGHEAAANLLDKAARAIDAGDVERGDHFIARACRLAFDRHEETHPAAWVAHMDLFNLVTDELEDSEPGDRVWLDAAIAAAASADERGRSEMRDVLTTVAAEYRLTRGEATAIRALAADLPSLTSAGDLRFGPDELEELADVVRSLLALQRTYADAVEALLGIAD